VSRGASQGVARCILLLRRREWTRYELAKELGVSPRTVVRYLKDIEAAGLDLAVREEPLDHNIRHFSLNTL